MDRSVKIRRKHVEVEKRYIIEATVVIRISPQIRKGKVSEKRKRRKKK